MRGELNLKAEELKKQGEQIIYTNGEIQPASTLCLCGGGGQFGGSG